MVKQAKTEESTKSRAARQEVVGEVVSDKMNKTISVVVFRQVKHAKYGKYMRRRSEFKAHDEQNEAKVGDKVLIVEARPLSKTKRWRLKTILEKAVTEGN
ncbi:MAG: 30S ribosomal protein S17 [Bdellovibrionales bacterium CG10_big_fil_rev_8_21_14_0_10_45_34]|nr:MAG: 30S ribosomal protein S17 [Bdellovibrionales bacterium CG10_big_fil_rev_8_21_14_0_10_45_34]